MLWLAGPEDDNGPLVNLTINGEALAQDLSAVSYEDLKVSLDPGGWYNIGLTASLGAYNRTAQKSVGVYEISYYPLDNVTRIRDVVPEALIEAFRMARCLFRVMSLDAQKEGADPELFRI